VKKRRFAETAGTGAGKGGQVRGAQGMHKTEPAQAHGLSASKL
jgi:hypothetical protein